MPIMSPMSLIVIGLLALMAPLWSSIGAAVLVSVVIVAAGIIQVLHSLNESRGDGLPWQLAIGACYVLAGLYMLVHPRAGVAALATLIAALLLVEGALRLLEYLRLRREPGAGLLLFDAAVTLLLSGSIEMTWPFNALWLPGAIAGISLIVTGVSRLLRERMDGRIYRSIAT